MDAKQTEFFRSLLTDRLSRLKEEAVKTRGDLTQEQENLPDSIDLASHESERDFSIRIRDRERRLISKIEEAMARLEEGNFGICVVCGEEISEKRLIARPMTTHCIDCKTAAEMLEKRQGML